MIKFLRNYKLRVQVDGSTGPYIEIANPITLSFQVQKGVQSSMANAVFQIYNLADKTRKRIFWDYFGSTNRPSVEFYAGYGSDQSLVYKGTIMEASSFRIGGSTDNITQIESQIGSLQTVSNYISTTLDAPISQYKVIQELIKHLAPLQEGYISPEFNIQHTRPVTLFGNAWTLLQQETGGYCFIDNGKVNCLKLSTKRIPSYDVFLLDSSTGLLGSPKRSKTFVTAEMLFEPRMGVGQAVQLISTDNSYLNALYTVYGIEHTGLISDAIGGQCKTKVDLFNPTIATSILVPSLMGV